jgi:hypothetical protein
LPRPSSFSASSPTGSSGANASSSKSDESSLLFAVVVAFAFVVVFAVVVTFAFVVAVSVDFAVILNAVKDPEEFNTPLKFRPFSQEPCLAFALALLAGIPEGDLLLFCRCCAVAFWLSSFAEGGGSAVALFLFLPFCHPERSVEIRAGLT